MYIEKLEVEEGFLNGLKVDFTPGLNVIIGARGTGKTSLIELIRFGLNAGASTNEAVRRTREHALSILGGGQVSLTLVHEGQRILVQRTHSDDGPRSNGLFIPPIVFSQTEIETLGLEPTGRLKLIDSFRESATYDDLNEHRHISEIKSLIIEASLLTRELDENERKLIELPNIEKKLKEATNQQAELGNTSEMMFGMSVEIGRLTEALSDIAVKDAQIERSLPILESWHHENNLRATQSLEPSNNNWHAWNVALKKMHEVQAIQGHAASLIAEAWHTLKQEKERLIAEKVHLDSQARAMRSQMDEAKQGMGAIMSTVQALQAQHATISAIQPLYETALSRLKSLREKRDYILDLLAEMRLKRFNDRVSVASNLNAKLQPQIHVGLMNNARPTEFSRILLDLLRGSGLKYSDVVEVLAKNLTPRTLVECVERFDTTFIAQATGLSLERAARVLLHLKNADLGELLTADSEDDVRLYLLDGSTYKEIHELSTGQRCTVVLPIILSHQARVVIVDQPEDHIDNSFIASTLIQAILGRTENNQFIFSTHNANIPVLGNADNVIHMASDGRRGYLSSHGSLWQPEIVEDISTIMEGGIDAFRARAQFYSKR